jgi:hypothetical protein
MPYLRPALFLIESLSKYDAIVCLGSLASSCVCFVVSPNAKQCDILSWLPSLLLGPFFIEFMWKYVGGHKSQRSEQMLAKVSMQVKRDWLCGNV